MDEQRLVEDFGTQIIKEIKGLREEIRQGFCALLQLKQRPGQKDCHKTRHPELESQVMRAIQSSPLPTSSLYEMFPDIGESTIGNAVTKLRNMEMIYQTKKGRPWHCTEKGAKYIYQVKM